MEPKKILIIAQTPPPFHGQAIMQGHLVDCKWDWCKKYFVRMNFSERINEVGHLKVKKIFSLFTLLFSIKKKLTTAIDLIYYPPAGPNRIPIYRDVIILFFLKLFSKKIILHFHAGGIDQIFKKVSKIEAQIIKKAFGKVDSVIVLSDWLKKETSWIRAKNTFVVNNGINDVLNNFPKKKNNENIISFLFAGNLKKEKGIFTLLQAANSLKKSGELFEIKFIGSFHDKKEEMLFNIYVNENNLQENIKLLGFKKDNDKWNEFSTADVLCLPTYETEAMPISILEAMMFELPVITTNWRSIPDIIQDGENGLLFEINNAEQLALCMKRMIHSADDRIRMGAKARRNYLNYFTIEQHLKSIELVFQESISQK